MIKREDVEALLGVCGRIAAKNLDPMKFSPIVPAPTLAALCRAWLALDEAPVGIVDIVSWLGDDSKAVEVYYENGPLNVEVMQRVRIVKEKEQ